MFIPRQSVVEDQFCQYKETSNTTGYGSVIAYAGAVCYLVEDSTNQAALVSIYEGAEPSDADERIPDGFLMQKVKCGYHTVHPVGYYMPGDLGSSDVIAQPKYSGGNIAGTNTAPVGVANLGIWDTDHYMVKYSGTLGTNGTVTDGDHMKPGQKLVVCDNSAGVAGAGTSRVTNHDTGQTSYGRFTNVTTTVARVVEGASAGQCAANLNNTTLFAIRIRLLI